MIEVSGVFSIAPAQEVLIFPSKRRRHTILRMEGNSSGHCIVIVTSRRKDFLLASDNTLGGP
jgi:hypothetical protein